MVGLWGGGAGKGVRVGGRQGGCIVRLHIVPRAGVGSSANLAALLPPAGEGGAKRRMRGASDASCLAFCLWRSEEHTSELQSLMRISYAVFCLKKKKQK